MSEKITEDDLELMAIELLEEQGYTYWYGPDIAHEGANPERQNYSDVLLRSQLKDKIIELNPSLPASAIKDAFKQVCSLSVPELHAANEKLHSFVTDGIEVEYQVGSDVRGDKVWLVDFEKIKNNDFVVCNQFTVIENNTQKRPDIILFINGLPLVVMELKNPVDENATVKKAYNQLQNYKNAIPTLFHYNAILIASDGLDARVGSLSAGFNRFMQWKTRDGLTEDSRTTPQIETLIKGILNPESLLDLIRHFTVFVKEKKEDKKTGVVSIRTAKIVAAYHQFYAVKKALSSVVKASKKGGTGKGGVVWHTQGSGKSYSMVFFAGMMIQKLNNPTVVVITDRNDLDDQLFDTFAASKQLLRQDPVQADGRDKIRAELKRAAGGVIFSTIQKFSPEEGETIYPQLSDRRNIVVIADEAHRSQYGFRAKTIYIKDQSGNQIGTKTAYGFAKYMRDALPNATYLGFSGTPIEAEDINTPAVFGHYIDIYDIEQSVSDRATVPIYYESRLAKIHVRQDAINSIDEEVSEAADGADDDTVENSKSKWTRVTAIVGSPERLDTVAGDIVQHFEKRSLTIDGKAMIVAMSRKIAVDLYKKITVLRPEWHDDNQKKGIIKVIMTSSSTDPETWNKHSTTKQQRRELGERLKDPDDPLKLVIVRDMWLTGFDAPCLHTLYVDKPMKGHNLMQAVARVNRVYKDKPGGLVVDYIGIASDLKKALSTYARSGGKGTPTNNLEDAFLILKEKIEVVSQLLQGSSSEKYYTADTRGRLRIILEAQEHVLGLEDGKNRFIRQATTLSKAYALCSSMKEVEPYKDEIAFYQAVKARLVKFESRGGGKSDEEVETAIKQIVDKALVSEGIVDIFDAAGIKKPDISILSDDFLEEVRGMEHKNVAIELLKKLLNDEIRVRSKKNLTQTRKLSEMLKTSIKRYQNNLLTATEVIQELIKLAKDIRAQDKRGENLGLTEDEYAFYSALEENDSAIKILGDEQLREISRALVEKVRKNTSIDWKIKENVRAKLRVLIKRVLRRYGYPPDLEKMAVDRILQQTELSAESWDGDSEPEINVDDVSRSEIKVVPCKDEPEAGVSVGSVEKPRSMTDTVNSAPEPMASVASADGSVNLSEPDGYVYLEQPHKDLVKWLHSQNIFSLEILKDHVELEDFGPPLISSAGNFVVYDQQDLDELDELPPDILADGTKVIRVDFTETENGNYPEDILIALEGGRR